MGAEFKGDCPECGAELEWIENGYDHEEGCKTARYTCWKCNWDGHVNRETDEFMSE